MSSRFILMKIVYPEIPPCDLLLASRLFFLGLTRCFLFSRVPTRYFCIMSRASNECPTSSNASVASLNAFSLIKCSLRTSSPPGCYDTIRRGNG